VDIPIVVPSDCTPRIQETHIAIIHVLCELIDDALFPDLEER
jgi:D-sedoheptulose 7-phosphate isomerase